MKVADLILSPEKIQALQSLIATLKQENERLCKLLYGAMCAYCGETIGKETLNQDISKKELKKHISECRKHPAYKLQQQLAEKEEQWRNAEDSNIKLTKKLEEYRKWKK